MKLPSSDTARASGSESCQASSIAAKRTVQILPYVGELQPIRSAATHASGGPVSTAGELARCHVNRGSWTPTQSMSDCTCLDMVVSCRARHVRHRQAAFQWRLSSSAAWRQVASTHGHSFPEVKTCLATTHAVKRDRMAVRRPCRQREGAERGARLQQHVQTCTCALRCVRRHRGPHIRCGRIC